MEEIVKGRNGEEKEENEREGYIYIYIYIYFGEKTMG
jgi:hypothetical protein